jgi:glycosidase
MGNVMDSHDKNRFMAFADGDLDASQWSAIEIGWNNPPQVDNPENYKKLILYMTYMNTIPGLPIVYYGSEFGMTGASDPDNRRMMRFGDELTESEQQTMDEVKKIINIRKEHSAFRYGDFYTLQADDDIYAYVRSDMNERLLVILNKNKKSKLVGLELPQQFNASTVIEITDGRTFSLEQNRFAVNIGGMNWMIFSVE